jgi:hypothetical protein
MMTFFAGMATTVVIQFIWRRFLRWLEKQPVHHRGEVP